MASAQEIMRASGPASPLVGRCSSLVETASPLAHTPATLEVVAPPSVPMYTSRPLMPLRLLVLWSLVGGSCTCQHRGAPCSVRDRGCATRMAYLRVAVHGTRSAIRYSVASARA